MYNPIFSRHELLVQSRSVKGLNVEPVLRIKAIVRYRQIIVPRLSHIYHDLNILS